VAIIGTITVTWPSSVASHFTTLQVFILDVDVLSFSCFVSEQASFRYIVKVLCFPVAILWIIGNFFFSKFLPQRLKWQWTKTANTIGNLIQVGFAVMTTVALESMMCYVHPNGTYSLVKYSSVTCGEGEQVTMMVAGVSLLVIFVIGFLAIVTYATFALPSWSSRMLRERVQSFNFLTYRFRLAQAILAQGWLKVGSAFLEYHRPTKRSTSTSDLVLQRQRGGGGPCGFPCCSRCCCLRCAGVGCRGCCARLRVPMLSQLWDTWQCLRVFVNTPRHCLMVLVSL
jgi:hypothetical protein